MAADISLTLVRTFAQGTWLQAVVLYDESRGYRLDGTLGRPGRATIRPQVFGAFPVDRRAPWSRSSRRILAQVERLRRTVDDMSLRPETVPVLVDIATSACTGGYTIATHTGDVVLDVRTIGASKPLEVPVPVGADLSVFVPSLYRVSNAGDARSFGAIPIDGPMSIGGRVAGDGRGGACPPAGRIVWRPASAQQVAELPVIGRCLIPGGASRIWRPGSIGTCLS